MPQTFRYWRTDGNLHLAAPGIRVLHNDTAQHAIINQATGRAVYGAFPADFSPSVRANLNYIYGTAIGQTLLNQLAATAHRPTIIPASIDNSIFLIGTNHVKPMAVELHRLTPGNATRTAVRAMVGPDRFLLGSDVIARAIRSTPRWTLDARPGHTDVSQLSWTQLFLQQRMTSYAQNLRDRLYRGIWGWDSNEGYDNDQMAISTQRGTTRGIYITRDEVQNWLVYGIWPNRLSTEEKQHIANVTIATLYQHAVAGAGSSGSISWRHQANYPLNSRRPPALGLAHELIHAYYASQGLNPGFHDAQPTMTLFEYICVGLGPFAGNGVNENTLRTQWPTTHVNIPLADLQNRTRPPQRVSYV